MSKAFAPGSSAWVARDRDEWELAEVKDRYEHTVKLKPEGGGKTIKVNLKKEKDRVFAANESVVSDMCCLQYLHVPGIMHNLKERSVLSDCPYTFLSGNVLVAVNPLQKVKEKIKLGSPSVISTPHPYAIAESAYQQLVFGIKRNDRDEKSETPVNQSIVCGGESGAGKTVSTKLVLKHLVARCLAEGSSDEDLDRRLIESNPILEAFGNASTKRNHNSSRFGKFMKIHYKTSKKKKKLVSIHGASINTYLLERSRITFHLEGERTYHIFYQLVNGSNKKLKRALKLESAFEYMIAKNPRDNKGKLAVNRRASIRLTHRMPTNDDDKNDFKKLCKALKTIGIDGEDEDSEVFKVVAAILHLGNVKFEDEDSSEGSVATVSNNNALDIASKLLDVKAKQLLKVFTERKVKTVGEELVKKRDAKAAKYALDAVVKFLYVSLFDWLVDKITASLSEKGSLKKLPFIGVLDIFGFETFRLNDFEQLLINFTNEALQSCFNQQIFEAEASLYEKEGLLVDEEERTMPPDNLECVTLLQGGGKKIKQGILTMIDAEGRNPQPSDEKLNSALHRQFKNHDYFPTPHPKDARNCFIVKHYAGNVKYTVGSFLEKNSDNLPDDIEKAFKSSDLEVISEIFAKRAAEDKSRKSSSSSSSSPRKNKKSASASVTAKFRAQMTQLIDELNETRCAFIRCIKPNASMRRGNDESWFDNTYVLPQLINLSIPQTAEVLKGGLPTRVDFQMFFDTYSELLPKSAIKTWESMGNADDKQFVMALFYAFEIPPDSYKIGLTKVFFKSGYLEQVNTLLNDGMEGKVDKKITKRFKRCFSRAAWRRAYAKVLVFNVFKKLLAESRDRKTAATILQRLARRRMLVMEAQEELQMRREEKEQEQMKVLKKQKEKEKKRKKELKKKLENARDSEDYRRIELEFQKADMKTTDRERKIKHLSLRQDSRKKKEKDIRRSVRFDNSGRTPSVRFVLTEEQEKRISEKKSYRRSYARAREADQIHEDGEDSESEEEEKPFVLAEGIQFQHVRPPQPPRRSGGNPEESMTRGRSLSSVVCFNKLFRRKSKRKLQGEGTEQQAGEEEDEYGYGGDWVDCLISLNGFQLRYYDDCEQDDDGDFVGKGDPIGTLQINGFSSLEEEESEPGGQRSQILVFSVGESIFKQAVVRFRFDDYHELGQCLDAYERSVYRFQFEQKQAARFEQGLLNPELSSQMQEYRGMLQMGLISQDEFETMLVMQLTSDEDLAQRDGESAGFFDSGDAYKIQCCDCLEYLFNLPTDPLDECPECGNTDLDMPYDVKQDILIHREQIEHDRLQAFEKGKLQEQNSFPFYIEFENEKFEFLRPTLVTSMNPTSMDTEYTFHMEWSRQVNGCDDWDDFLMSSSWEDLRDFFEVEIVGSGELSMQQLKRLPHFPDDLEKSKSLVDLAEHRRVLLEKFLIDFLKVVQKDMLFQSRRVRTFLGMNFR